MTAYKDSWRIAKIALDEDTILWRNADVEQERRVAIYDLIEENVFKPVRAVAAGHDGPYDLRLAVQDGRLALAIATLDGTELETLVLGLARFRRPIRDYFAICDSYYQAIRKATAQEIETLHRTGYHDNMLRDLLQRDMPLTASVVSADSHSMHNFLPVDGDGRPELMVGSHVDISMLKRYEADVRTSLVAHPAWWGRATHEGNVDEAQFIVIQSDATRLPRSIGEQTLYPVLVDRARLDAAPSVAMLAQIASQARILLGR